MRREIDAAVFEIEEEFGSARVFLVCVTQSFGSFSSATFWKEPPRTAPMTFPQTSFQPAIVLSSARR